MNFLLDTHTLLWTLLYPEKLSNSATKIIEDTSFFIFASVINYWEISIKVERGKLDLEGFLPEDLPKLSEEMGFKTFDLNDGDSTTFYKLVKNYHRDPFDRMLIWQALNNDYTLLTRDPDIKQYEQIGLKTLW